MEQRSLWEHLPGKETAGTKTRGPLGAIHSLKIHNHSTIGGEWNKKASGRKILAGRNPMEIEISGSMAQWGREKHQIIPPVHDPQIPNQSHYETGRPTRKHPINPSGNITWIIVLLQGSPLRTNGGSYLCNWKGDPKYPNYHHPGT